MAVKKEWGEVASSLPKMPNFDVIEQVKKKLRMGVMLYRAGWVVDPITEMKEKVVLGTCTACGDNHCFGYTHATGGCHNSWGGRVAPFGYIDSIYGDVKVSHNCCLCPMCGAELEALHISAFKERYLIDSNEFLTAAVVKGHYVFLGWRLDKYCNKEGAVEYVVRKVDAMTVIGKRAVRFSGYQKTGFFGSGTLWCDEWIARPNYFSDYYTWDYEDAYGIDERETVGTEIEKSGAIVFLLKKETRVPLAAYLKLWAKYPNVENLVRSGRVHFVGKLISASEYTAGWYIARTIFEVTTAKKYVNFKKTKPHEMLGVEKCDVELADKYTIDMFSFFRTVWQREGVRLSSEELGSALSFGLRNTIEVSEEFGQPITRIVRYLQKQRAYRPNADVIRATYLRDYWDMTKIVYDEITNSLLYPKNLIAQHDQIQNVYMAKQKELFNKEIKRYAEELEPYIFEDEETGLMIRPCRSQTELIKEGKALAHCVARYAEDVAKRKTSIFFIRKIAEPNKSFFTLEYKNGVVNQNRGLKNCGRTEEVALFEEKWLKFLRDNKEIQNGKRSNENAESYACA